MPQVGTQRLCRCGQWAGRFLKSCHNKNKFTFVEQNYHVDDVNRTPLSNKLSVTLYGI